MSFECRRRRPRRQAGMVTAEMAVLLPSLVLVTAALAWLVSLGVAQVQCVDAARDAARALARAEPETVARRLAEQSAPDGARIRFRTDDGMVEVEVSYRATPPGQVLDVTGGLSLRGTASLPLEVTDAPAG